MCRSLVVLSPKFPELPDQPYCFSLMSSLSLALSITLPFFTVHERVLRLRSVGIGEQTRLTMHTNAELYRLVCVGFYKSCSKALFSAKVFQCVSSTNIDSRVEIGNGVTSDSIAIGSTG